MVILIKSMLLSLKLLRIPLVRICLSRVYEVLQIDLLSKMF